MKDFLLQLRDKLLRPQEEESNPNDYVQVDQVSESGERKAKVLVRPFMLEEFEDIKGVLDALREGTTIALVNIRPLKDKDIVELKRAISKLRKTCEAIDGDVAGFGEDYIVATPFFARVYKNRTEE